VGAVISRPNDPNHSFSAGKSVQSCCVGRLTLWPGKSYRSALDFKLSQCLPLVHSLSATSNKQRRVAGSDHRQIQRNSLQCYFSISSRKVIATFDPPCDRQPAAPGELARPRSSPAGVQAVTVGWAPCYRVQPQATRPLDRRGSCFQSNAVLRLDTDPDSWSRRLRGLA
jgi:hypothetical protein